MSLELVSAEVSRGLSCVYNNHKGKLIVDRSFNLTGPREGRRRGVCPVYNNRKEGLELGIAFNLTGPREGWC